MKWRDPVERDENINIRMESGGTLNGLDDCQGMEPLPSVTVVVSSMTSTNVDTLVKARLGPGTFTKQTLDFRQSASNGS